MAFILSYVQGRGALPPNSAALSAAQKAISYDDQNLLGHFVVCQQSLLAKDYFKAAQEYRLIDKLSKSLRNDFTGELEESGELGFVVGYLEVSFSELFQGLIDINRPFEAYHLVLEGHTPWEGLRQSFPASRSGHYLGACAAARAGTGQGLDTPLPEARLSIRKHALEWLNTSFDISIKAVAKPPILCASVVGLLASPPTNCSLFLAISTLSAGKADEISTGLEFVNQEMNQWLNDPDLAGVRDDKWLAKLPSDEQEQWRKLWTEVRSLRDRTAPRKTAPPIGK